MNMKTTLTLAAAVLVATTAFAAPVTGTTTVTNGNAAAKLKVRKAITLDNTADLNFGGVLVAAAPTAGTVTVSTAGGPSFSGGVLSLFNGTAAAAFTVGGTTNATYTINAIPGVSMNGPAPLTPIPVVFTLSKGSGTLTGGTDTFTVGGTASIPAGVTDGDYTNTFSVTVLYN